MSVSICPTDRTLIYLLCRLYDAFTPCIALIPFSLCTHDRSHLAPTRAVVLRGSEADCREVAAYARSAGIESFAPANRSVRCHDLQVRAKRSSQREYSVDSENSCRRCIALHCTAYCDATVLLQSHVRHEHIPLVLTLLLQSLSKGSPWSSRCKRTGSDSSYPRHSSPQA